MAIGNILERSYEMINRDQAAEEAPHFPETPAQEAGPSHQEGGAILPFTGHSTPTFSEAQMQAAFGEVVNADARLASIAGSAFNPIDSTREQDAGLLRGSQSTPLSSRVMNWVHDYPALEAELITIRSENAELKRNQTLIIQSMNDKFAVFARQLEERKNEINTAMTRADEYLSSIRELQSQNEGLRITVDRKNNEIEALTTKEEKTQKALEKTKRGLQSVVKKFKSAEAQTAEVREEMRVALARARYITVAHDAAGKGRERELLARNAACVREKEAAEADTAAERQAREAAEADTAAERQARVAAEADAAAVRGRERVLLAQIVGQAERLSGAMQQLVQAEEDAQTLRATITDLNSNFREFKQLVLNRLSQSAAIVDGQNVIEGRNFEQILLRIDEIARESIELKATNKKLKWGVGAATAVAVVGGLSGMGLAVPLAQKVYEVTRMIGEVCRAYPGEVVTATAGGMKVVSSLASPQSIVEEGRESNRDVLLWRAYSEDFSVDVDLPSLE